MIRQKYKIGDLMSFLEFDETRDFPYYKNNPRISKKGWLLLLFMVPVALILYSLSSSMFNSDIIGSLIFCLLLLVPLLYLSNWDYGLLFYRPTRDEIILAVLMFVGYMAYSIIVGSVLDAYGLSGMEGGAETFGITVETTIGLIFSMMGEELVKLIPLMFLMRFVYKFTSNRNLAIAVSSIIILIGFGLLHYAPPYSTVISVLALQGFGTIFELYGYLRTKNLFVPYISHLLTDAFVFIIILLGM